MKNVFFALFLSCCFFACGIDADNDGVSANLDCNDNDASIRPDQDEPCACDNIDSNCNGDPNDFLCDLACVDNDQDGFFLGDDCNDNDASIHPDQEEPCVCDNIDQNCNGENLDFLCNLACLDQDGDGFFAGEDCNDTDATVRPGLVEPCTCDAIDQNCNDLIDDFPCDIACQYIPEGQVCGQPEQTNACEPGLNCCYPCGVAGCDNLCTQPCQDGEPGCNNGCFVFP